MGWWNQNASLAEKGRRFWIVPRVREFLLIQNSHFEVLSALVDEFREQALSRSLRRIVRYQSAGQFRE